MRGRIIVNRGMARQRIPREGVRGGGSGAWRWPRDTQGEVLSPATSEHVLGPNYSCRIYSSPDHFFNLLEKPQIIPRRVYKILVANQPFILDESFWNFLPFVRPCWIYGRKKTKKSTDYRAWSRRIILHQFVKYSLNKYTIPSLKFHS